jgi:hypothetical protein
VTWYICDFPFLVAMYRIHVDHRIRVAETQAVRSAISPNDCERSGVVALPDLKIMD